MHRLLVSFLAHQPEADLERPATWQFFLRGFFAFLSLAAFFSAWLVWFRQPLETVGYFPGTIGLASIAFAIASSFFSLLGRSVRSAWTLCAIAIQLTCFNIAIGLLEVLRTTDTSDGIWPRGWMQQILTGNLIASLTMPMVVIFTAMLQLFLSHWPSRQFAVWIIASTVASSVAVTGLVMAVFFTFGTLVYK